MLSVASARASAALALSGRYRGSFGVEPLLHDPIDLRSHFRDEVGRGASRQFTAENDRRRGERNYRDGHGTAALGGVFRAAACGHACQTDDYKDGPAISEPGR